MLASAVFSESPIQHSETHRSQDQTEATPTTSGVFRVALKISDKETTLFTGEQLYLPGNASIYLLQMLKHNKLVNWQLPF
jgi:hypothetical protein